MKRSRVRDKKISDLLLIKKKSEEIRKEIKGKEMSLIIWAIEDRADLLLRMFQINNLRCIVENA